MMWLSYQVPLAAEVIHVGSISTVLLGPVPEWGRSEGSFPKQQLVIKPTGIMQPAKLDLHPQ